MSMENMINDAEMVSWKSTAAQIKKKLDAIERFREYMMDVYDADWFRNHVGTSVGNGWDHVFGGHRMIVEGPNNVNNKTGKWTLAMYKYDDGNMIEIGRDVIGGKVRVSNWEKVACLAHIWINHELDAMMYALDEAKKTLDEINEVDWWERDDEAIMDEINEAIDAVGDENEYDEEIDDMFEYAMEASDAIEDIVVGIEEDYDNIDYELNHTSKTDWDFVKELVEGVYEKLTSIHNELEWCLARCDERTGCAIGWDDFCGADYFSDIKLPEGYSVTDFIDVFDNDQTDFMEHIMCCLWRSMYG